MQSSGYTVVERRHVLRFTYINNPCNNQVVHKRVVGQNSPVFVASICSFPSDAPGNSVITAPEIVL